MVSQRIAGHAAACAAAILLLCIPALWNGFPLMFDDVGGYLERWPTGTLGIGRSTVYGLLLWVSRSAAFVPAILLQAAVTVFVVDRAIAIFVGRDRPPWAVAVTIAVMAGAGGAAIAVSMAIPDAWAAPAVLAVHLLAWHSERLSTGERAAMAAIVAFAGASHMATFGVLAGLAGLYAIAWLVRRRIKVAPSGILLAVAAVWSGIALLLAGNAVVTGRAVLAAEGDIFLFGRMVEDGMAAAILADECPRPDWQMCEYRDALPEDQEAFIFQSDSPLQKIGGENDPRARQEIAAIIARSLARHPVAHLLRAVELAATQFVNLGTGDAMAPLWSWHTRWSLSRHAPGTVPFYDAARQQSGTINLGMWSDWIVTPVSLTASFALPMLVLLLWRHGRRREAMLPAALFLALVGNATLCGVISSPNDRYQARLAWLTELTVGLTVSTLANRKTVGALGGIAAWLPTSSRPPTEIPVQFPSAAADH